MLGQLEDTLRRVAPFPRKKNGLVVPPASSGVRSLPLTRRFLTRPQIVQFGQLRWRPK